MMTVAEEVERALQIASIPQKVNSSGASSAQEATNSIASKAAATSNDPPSPISSPGNVTVQGSPAFSLNLQSFSNTGAMANESWYEKGSTIGGYNILVVSDR